VRYEELLDDWTQAVARVGEQLDLEVVRSAPATSMRGVHEFIDRTLSRSRADWGELKIPAALRARADEVWELVTQLADGNEGAIERLDATRAAYIGLYEEAEAIAQSSIVASRRPAPATNGRIPGPAGRLVARVPKRYRRKLPLRFRQQVVRALARR
jgi:hypothetical protein